MNVWAQDTRAPLHYPGKDTSRGEEITALLIEHGADVNAGTNEGHTSLDQMLHNGRADLTEVSRRYGGHQA